MRPAAAAQDRCSRGSLADRHAAGRRLSEAPGLSTPEVEALISLPIESALAGVPGVKTIRSKSALGLSSVVLILDGHADRMEARQHVQERVAVGQPTYCEQVQLSFITRVLALAVAVVLGTAGLSPVLHVHQVC